MDRDRLAVRALEDAERLAGSRDLQLARQSAWYLAIGYWRTGQLDRARLRLTILCDNPGEFSERACTANRSMGLVTLSGTITAIHGTPLAGVTVGHYLVDVGTQAILTRTSFASASDASGKYTIVGVPEVRGTGLVLRAAKPGYFSARGGTRLHTEMRADFQLRPWAIVPLDDVVKGTLDAADDGCGDVNEPCRQLAVVAPSSGLLDVSLTTATPRQMDAWVEDPGGDVHSPAIGAPLRVLIPVVAGATYQITIQSWVPNSPPFELTMQLK